MTAPRVPAIQTRYAGCYFRSRTEARWAVFFDALGVPWEYEREGYALPSGRYLPDFWLPQQRYWVEIKGKQPTEHEEQILRELGQATGAAAYVFWGYPADYTTGDIPAGNDGGYSVWPHWDNLHWPCLSACPHAKFGIEYMGMCERIRCCTGNWKPEYSDRNYFRLRRAYEFARSARFGT